MSKQTLILASSNAGKIVEINALLSETPYEVHSQSEFNVEDVEETGLSFVENALLKARHASQITGLPAIADDSGIVVDALNGQPGIYSARYAGEPSDDQKNLHKLLTELSDVPDEKRSGRFVCSMVYMRHHLDPVPIIAQGIWEGSISREAKGEGGFGYDPIFFVPSHACTSAQLSAEEKNRLSHRGQALRSLIQAISQ